MSKSAKRELHIRVDHLTRVEGHGNIVVNVSNGKIEDCRWEVVEAPRFFEAMVRGRKWYEMHHITSRICGICSIGHTLASLQATEAALGIEVSEQTVLLRKLALHAENLQSHILHVGYLVLPDLMGVGSVVPLAGSHPAELKTVIRTHRLANVFSDTICGRTTHPQRLVPGGFVKYPKVDELKKLHQGFAEALSDLKEVARLVCSLAERFPAFNRETEYIALKSDQEYAMYHGQVGSSDGGTWAPGQYKEVTNEFCVPHSTAKYTKHNRVSYMVGALARFNLNADRLTPEARAVARLFKLKPVCYNSFMNNVAQIVECVHSVGDSINIIDRVLDRGLALEDIPPIKVCAGRGVSAVEVPRGTLFHDYLYDDAGTCTGANLIIPTNQNHNNIYHDLQALLPSLLGKPEKEIELGLEMLVRAYDPCISCSTHYLKVKFKK
jgi:coenzyme F420-reducing hydrogenase alpha subunit